MSSNVVYAIVKSGGRQEKVSVGDIVVMDRQSAKTGTAEVVRDEKGPKIDILKYKNKTGYRRRLGHRQKLTRVKVTSIS